MATGAGTDGSEELSGWLAAAPPIDRGETWRGRQSTAAATRASWSGRQHHAEGRHATAVSCGRPERKGEEKEKAADGRGEGAGTVGILY
jgi:hypothetical protein